MIESLVPKELRPRFHFYGKQPLGSRTDFLSRARVAVVPLAGKISLYTCIEAMSSGLPVLASRQGGMAEMIRDGRSGWLAFDGGNAALAAGLRRALETEPAIVAEMGHHAATDIRRMCDNEQVIDKHRRFRSELASLGPKVSLNLPDEFAVGPTVALQRQLRPTAKSA